MVSPPLSCLRNGEWHKSTKSAEQSARTSATSAGRPGSARKHWRKRRICTRSTSARLNAGRRPCPWRRCGNCRGLCGCRWLVSFGEFRGSPSRPRLRQLLVPVPRLRLGRHLHLRRLFVLRGLQIFLMCSGFLSDTASASHGDLNGTIVVTLRWI